MAYFRYASGSALGSDYLGGACLLGGGSENEVEVETVS